MPFPHTSAPAAHRDLVTAYLLAQAGLPFTLDLDADGRHLASPVPAQADTPRQVS
jgi:hypothetical protein